MKKNFEKNVYWLVMVMMIMTLFLSGCGVSFAEPEGVPMAGGKVAAPAVVEPETATAVSEIKSSTQTSEALEALVPTSTATVEPTPSYTATPTIDPVCEGLTNYGCAVKKLSNHFNISPKVFSDTVEFHNAYKGKNFDAGTYPAGSFSDLNPVINNVGNVVWEMDIPQEKDTHKYLIRAVKIKDVKRVSSGYGYNEVDRVTTLGRIFSYDTSNEDSVIFALVDLGDDFNFSGVPGVLNNLFFPGGVKEEVADIRVIDSWGLSSEDFAYFSDNPIFPEDTEGHYKYLYDEDAVVKITSFGEDVLRVSLALNWEYKFGYKTPQNWEKPRENIPFFSIKPVEVFSSFGAGPSQTPTTAFIMTGYYIKLPSGAIDSRQLPRLFVVRDEAHSFKSECVLNFPRHESAFDLKCQDYFFQLYKKSYGSDHTILYTGGWYIPEDAIEGFISTNPLPGVNEGVVANSLIEFN